MSTAPLVSFVVPCYNYARYLGECLKSIFGQEGGHDFEIVAVDDGSTDGTRQVLHSFADPRLRVITHQRNLGHAATINEGLNYARGLLIARIDPDDRYKPAFLSMAIEKFRAFPEIGLVYGNVALIDAEGKVTLEAADRAHGGKDFKGNEFLRLLEKNFICSASVIARREAWQQVPPVPQRLAFHDWYFTLMMARRFEFYYVDRVIADYRVHEANYHAKIAREKREEASIFWLLSQIYRERETNPDLERAKQRIKKRVWASHYVDIGEKYFGFEMYRDARRCYLTIVCYQPGLLVRSDLLRHVCATLIGQKLYEGIKRVVRSIFRGNGAT